MEAIAVYCGMILFSSPLQTVYGVTGMTAWLIGMLVMAILASALPARSASRLTIKDTLAHGESIKLSGFGTFSVRSKGSRRGRNPKTGVEIEIEPRRVVTFKPSVQFKSLVEHSTISSGGSDDGGSDDES